MKASLWSVYRFIDRTSSLGIVGQTKLGVNGSSALRSIGVGKGILFVPLGF